MDPLSVKDSSRENPHARAPQHWGQVPEQHSPLPGTTWRAVETPKAGDPGWGSSGQRKRRKRRRKEEVAALGLGWPGTERPLLPLRGREGKGRRGPSSAGEGRCSAKGGGRHRTPHFPAASPGATPKVSPSWRGAMHTLSSFTLSLH